MYTINLLFLKNVDVQLRRYACLCWALHLMLAFRDYVEQAQSGKVFPVMYSY